MFQGPGFLALGLLSLGLSLLAWALGPTAGSWALGQGLLKQQLCVSE